jgi:phosphoinositide-3-kinase regulatory subunit 4
MFVMFYILSQLNDHSILSVLCLFPANDVLLSHMITFLNDKEDKQLRASFFKCIIGVTAYVGCHSSSILTPLLQQVMACNI